MGLLIKEELHNSYPSPNILLKMVKQVGHLVHMERG
jgi:hypothetical protein